MCKGLLDSGRLRKKEAKIKHIFIIILLTFFSIACSTSQVEQTNVETSITGVLYAEIQLKSLNIEPDIFVHKNTSNFFHPGVTAVISKDCSHYDYPVCIESHKQEVDAKKKVLKLQVAFGAVLERGSYTLLVWEEGKRDDNCIVTIKALSECTLGTINFKVRSSQ